MDTWLDMEEETQAAPEPRRVLFVDDEKNVLTGFRMLLRPLRGLLRVDAAQGGHEALEMLGQRRYHAVVTDIRMPDMDGEELLREIVAQHPGVFRVVLTGMDGEELRERLSGLAHVLLVKPCRFADLRDTLVAFTEAGD